jgi:predicted CXXCH cytochrome family protein
MTRLLLALTLLLCTSVAQGGAHPVGRVDADKARASGVDPELDRVRCLDCHVSHGAQSEALQRFATAGDVCMECHDGMVTRASPLDHPVGEAVEARKLAGLQAQGMALGREGTVVCSSCHAVHSDEPSTRGCVSCHEEQDSHGPAGERPACVACHGVHDGVGPRAELTATDGDPDGCMGCHGQGGEAFVEGCEPGVLGHPLVGAEHDGEPLACTSCHDLHRPGLDKEDACLDCHREQHEDAERGGHGTTTCIDCHPVHTAYGFDHTTFPEVNQRSWPCLDCHSGGRDADAPQVEDYQHPAPIFEVEGARWHPLGKLPLFDEEGMEVPAGESGALACATCHWTHGPEGAVDSLRRRGWEFPCASCHGDDALPLYRYFHQPERRAGIIEKTLWTDRPEDAIPVQSQPAQPNPPIPSGPNQESR